MHNSLYKLDSLEHLQPCPQQAPPGDFFGAGAKKRPSRAPRTTKSAGSALFLPGGRRPNLAR